MPHPPTDDRPGLSPPQFRLGTLLIVVSVICGLLGALVSLPPLYSFTLLLFALMVAVHVFGNYIGTRLRENGDRRVAAERSRGDAVRLPPPRPCLTTDQFAPTTNLGRRYSLGSIVLVVAGACGLAGAVVGGAAMALAAAGRHVLAHAAMGGLAFGVLGGVFGLLAAMFVGAAYDALRQAHRESEK